MIHRYTGVSWALLTTNMVRCHWLHVKTGKGKLCHYKRQTNITLKHEICSGTLGVLALRKALCSGGSKLLHLTSSSVLSSLMNSKPGFEGGPWTTWYPHQGCFVSIIGFAPVDNRNEHSNLQTPALEEELDFPTPTLFP